jgi:hypothetical protein
MSRSFAATFTSAALSIARSSVNLLGSLKSNKTWKVPYTKVVYDSEMEHAPARPLPAKKCRNFACDQARLQDFPNPLTRIYESGCAYQKNPATKQWSSSAGIRPAIHLRNPQLQAVEISGFPHAISGNRVEPSQTQVIGVV